MSADERDRLFEWLLVNGGPVVRYRTAHELCGDLPPVEVKRLEQELAASPKVEYWLSHLNLGNLGKELDNLSPEGLVRLGAMVHGGKPTALENVLGRLNEMGLRAGFADLDRRMLPLMRIFHWQGNWQTDAQYRSAWESLVKSIFAWGLLRAGYTPDPAMQDYLCALVDINHKIARDQVFDLYATGDELKGLPRAWAGKPILKQAVVADYHLPLIHDLYVLANLPAWMCDETITEKINDIIHYVLDPRFQAFPPGYGYAWIRERRTCYSWGWSPHLAGFSESNWQDLAVAGQLVQQLELMASFPAARESRWFQSGLRHLEFYRGEDGIYCFPVHYLRDAPSGYYVSGYCMGLDENRRLHRGLEIESTFHMSRIRAGWDCFDRIML
jgi:hypothetical protein